MNEPTVTPSEVAILLPVYNDASALAQTLRGVESALQAIAATATVVAVDDGSIDRLVVDATVGDDRMIREIHCMRLRGNLGHQRAIAIGLCYIYEHVDSAAVVVMDADGEDRPADVARLIEQLRRNGGSRMVFAERRRRSEGLLFTISYALFRTFARALTAHRVRVGNFSVIPREQLERLVVSPDLWSHFAAAAFQARIPRESIPTERGTRHHGRSTMNFVALVTHGLSAISVFGATVGVRVIMACGLLSATGALLWLLYTGSILGRGEAPGTGFLIASGLTVFFLLQLTLSAFTLVFIILNGRNKLGFLPIRDYGFFIQDVNRTGQP